MLLFKGLWLVPGVAFSPRSVSCSSTLMGQEISDKAASFGGDAWLLCAACVPLLAVYKGDIRVRGEGWAGTCRGSYGACYCIRRRHKMCCLRHVVTSRCPWGSGWALGSSEKPGPHTACPRLLLFPFLTPFSHDCQVAQSQAFYAFSFCPFRREEIFYLLTVRPCWKQSLVGF